MYSVPPAVLTLKTSYLASLSEKTAGKKTSYSVMKKFLEAISAAGTCSKMREHRDKL